MLLEIHLMTRYRLGPNFQLSGIRNWPVDQKALLQPLQGLGVGKRTRMR